MTVFINGVMVNGRPDEIKELLDMYNPPKINASNNTRWFIDHHGKVSPIGEEINDDRGN